MPRQLFLDYFGTAERGEGKEGERSVTTVIGVSVSEPLPSDVYVDFVCLSWTGIRHGNGACVSFFARGSVCYYGYSLSSEHR